MNYLATPTRPNPKKDKAARRPRIIRTSGKGWYHPYWDWCKRTGNAVSQKLPRNRWISYRKELEALNSHIIWPECMSVQQLKSYAATLKRRNPDLVIKLPMR